MHQKTNKDLDVSHGHEAPVVTIVAQAKDNLIISLPQYLKALRSHKLQLEGDGRLNEFSISRVNNSWVSGQHRIFVTSRAKRRCVKFWLNHGQKTSVGSQRESRTNSLATKSVYVIDYWLQCAVFPILFILLLIFATIKALWEKPSAQTMFTAMTFTTFYSANWFSECKEINGW